MRQDTPQQCLIRICAANPVRTLQNSKHARIPRQSIPTTAANDAVGARTRRASAYSMSLVLRQGVSRLVATDMHDVTKFH